MEMVIANRSKSIFSNCHIGEYIISNIILLWCSLRRMCVIVLSAHCLIFLKKQSMVSTRGWTWLIRVFEKNWHPKRGNKHIYLPPTCFPLGYSSNVRILEQMKNLKLINLKSHDYHTPMQQLLPIAVRNVLLRCLWIVIMRFCRFFNDICSKSCRPLEVR